MQMFKDVVAVIGITLIIVNFIKFLARKHSGSLAPVMNCYFFCKKT